MPCPYQRICIIIKVKWYKAKIPYRLSGDEIAAILAQPEANTNSRKP